jgi:hypothetical protein
VTKDQAGNASIWDDRKTNTTKFKKKSLEIRYRLPIKIVFFYPAQPYRFQNL